MLHQVGVSFDLYYDARKHKIKKKLSSVAPRWTIINLISTTNSVNTLSMYMKLMRSKTEQVSVHVENTKAFMYGKYT